ncbi:hypothetical protein Tco_0709820 [Tanacetum coccineum]
MYTYLKNMAGYKNNQLNNKSFDDIQKLFDKAMKRVNIIVDMETKLVEGSEVRAEAEIAQESSSKRASTKLEQESIKKQKVDEDKETAELQKLIEVVPDKEEVAIDAIPLATKPPSIADYKIHKEGKKTYYQMIRADGSSKMYLVFSHMLKSFDREDLETLWKLVKGKRGSTRPEEGYERVLWGDLKTMFDPHVEDQGRIVGIKRLLDDLRVTDVKVRVTAAKQNLVLFTKEFKIHSSGINKDQLYGLLSDALKDTLPPLLKDPIRSSILQSITKELPHVEAQVQKNLHDQLPTLLLKPMYKEFNAFNKLESQRFVILRKELSKSLHKNIKKSIRLKVRKGMKEVQDKLTYCTDTVATNSQHVQDLRVMFHDMVSLLEAAEVFKKANAEGENADNVQREQPPAQGILNAEKALVVHNLEERKEGTVSMEDDSTNDDLDKQPLSKRFKIVTPIPNPIPLNTFAPKDILKPEKQHKSLNDFTNQLFATTSSKFSPTPPREPTPPRDPAKGK